MTRTISTLALVAALGTAAVAQDDSVETPTAAEAQSVEAPYDLLFKEGTLDDIAEDATLVYRRDVTNIAKPEAAQRDTGLIALDIQEDEPPVAELEFRQGDRYRGLGSFPASVGNPMIMYFYEVTVRDMAEVAGGSPFYIRNRVKEALTQPGEIVDGEAEVGGETVPTRTVTLRPFEEDPNRDRMNGFGDLELEVTMSEEVPGWYLSLTARAPDPRGGDGPLYLSDMRFEEIETGETDQ